MTETVSIKVPFPGLYHSIIAQELDHVEEREAEYFADERQAEENVPEALRLDQAAYAEILYRHSDYKQAHEAIAKDYCETFEALASESLGFDLGLKFEEMTSPKYYNFETDRLFATVPFASVEKLFEMSKADGHKALGKVLAERHTSRDGFHSFYSNDLEEWTEKPLEDWDHNELESLFLAVLALHGDEDEEITRRVSWAMIEDGEVFYTIHSDCVDWSKVDADVAEAREELAAAMREELGEDWEPPYRCPVTPDLFQGAH